jgi:hypothetical protein
MLAGMLRGALAIALWTAVACIVTLPAHAQDASSPSRLGDALAAYEAGDFTGAAESLRAFERDATTHEASELHDFYELTALLSFATEDEPRLDEALRALVALDPDHLFSARIPPEVVARFVELRELHPVEILTLDVSLTSPSAETVRVESRLRGSATYLVQRVVVSVRDEASSTWQRLEGASTQRYPGGVTLLYYAEAVGPAGVVLASVASREQPLSMHVEPLLTGASATPTPADTTDSPHEETNLLLVVGLGAGVLVLAGIGVGIGYAVYANQPRPHRLGANDVDFVLGMVTSF